MAELFGIWSIMMLSCQMIDQSEKSGPSQVWEGQIRNIVSLIVVLAAVALVLASLSNPHPKAFWIAISFPILHKVRVWTTWRIEVQTSSVSRSIGLNCYQLVFYSCSWGNFCRLLGWPKRTKVASIWQLQFWFQSH